MNYMKVIKEDTVNGPGFRTTLFVSGCTLACKGCFNQESWPFDAGQPFDNAAMYDVIDSCEPDHIDGMSILGGDPCNPLNIWHVIELCLFFRNKYGSSKTIWLWSGYKRSHIEKMGGGPVLLELIDTLVDGPYIESMRDSGLEYRGSSNQKIIHFTNKKESSQ